MINFGNLARHVGRSSSNDDSGIVPEDDIMDIITFIESPFGLKFSKELSGSSLFPVQKFILKMFYNMDLDSDDPYIVIPRSWRHIGSDAPGAYHKFTETEYLEYLYNEGRCNIKVRDHDRKEMILPVGRRGGKCLAEDQMVQTKKGLLRMDEILPKPLREYDVGKWYDFELGLAQEGIQQSKKSSAFFVRGVEKTKKVRTHCGYSIEGTHEHRVKVMHEDGNIGWKLLGDLSEGDTICIHRNTYMWPESNLDVRSLHNTEGHEDIHLPSHLDAEWGLRLGSLSREGTWADKSIQGNFRFPGVRTFLQSLGCSWDCKSDTKRVPWSIRRSPKEVVSSYLTGLFETEGWCSGKQVAFSTASTMLAQDVQLLLLNFGVVSSIRTKLINDTPYHTLKVSDLDSTNAFQYEIDSITSPKLGYFFDPVVLVEDSEAFTCDFNVPESHAYVAQGMTNHNSTISAMIATYETYKLIRRYNPQKYYGTPESATIQICALATSREQAGILYKEVRRHFNNCQFFQQYMHAETQTQATFFTPRDMEIKSNPSVRLTFYSAVAKGIRGSANIAAIMDEVAFFAHTGQSSSYEVYEALSPSLAQFSPKDPTDASKPISDSDGRLILISSPYARQGLFYDQYAMALSGTPGSKGLLMIQAPTWEINPTIPFEYFEKEYDKNPIAFITEFGAEFTDKVKSWIERDEDLLACVNPELKPALRGRAREKHYLGLDLAPRGDRTVLTLTKIVDGIVQVVYHEQWQAKTSWYDINPHLKEPMTAYAKGLESVETLDYEQVTDWVAEVCRKFYIVEGVFDRYEGIGFEQILHKKGLTQLKMKHFSAADSSEIFQAFKILMYNEMVELYDYVLEDDIGVVRQGYSPYIQELLELQGTARGKHLVSVEAPQVRGKHDDFADSMVRAVWLATQRLSKGKSSGGRFAGTDSGGRSPRDVNDFKRQRKKRRNYHSKRSIPRGQR